MIATLSLAKGVEKVDTASISMNIKVERATAKTCVSETSGSENKQIEVKEFTESERSVIWNNTVKKVIDTSNNNSAKYTTDSLCYADKFPYYIEMGESSGTALRWLIVGYMNNGVVTQLRTKDKVAFSKKMLLDSTDYVLLSETALSVGQKFKESNDSYDDGINANDYYRSNIRNFLTSTESTGFAEVYSLTNTSIKIKARAVSDLYKDIKKQDEDEGHTVPGTLSSEFNGESDKFWLLSEKEIYAIFEVNKTITDYYSYSITTAGPGASASYTNWWYRSPSTSNTYDARRVYSTGHVRHSTDVSNTTMGVRAALVI